MYVPCGQCAMREEFLCDGAKQLYTLDQYTYDWIVIWYRGGTGVHQARVSIECDLTGYGSGV